jgi:hypothetical protein
LGVKLGVKLDFQWVKKRHGGGERILRSDKGLRPPKIIKIIKSKISLMSHKFISSQQEKTSK